MRLRTFGGLVLSLGLLFTATIASAQTEVLVPPTSVTQKFILSDNFIPVEAAQAAEVGYPLWQKVGMNGHVNAVPANWCTPLLAAKPWLRPYFTGVNSRGQQLSPEAICWRRITEVTAFVEKIEVPKNHDWFWRTRPQGFEYWVPSFNVTQADFLVFMGGEIPAADAFDPTVLAERIQAFEERLKKTEAAIAALVDGGLLEFGADGSYRLVNPDYQEIFEAMDFTFVDGKVVFPEAGLDESEVDTRIGERFGSELEERGLVLDADGNIVQLTEDRARAIAAEEVGKIIVPTLSDEEKTAIAEEAAGLVPVSGIVSGLPVPFTDRTIPWWSLWAAFGVIFGLMLIGTLARQESWKKLAEVEKTVDLIKADVQHEETGLFSLGSKMETMLTTVGLLNKRVSEVEQMQTYLLERDVGGRFDAPPELQSRLNNMSENMSEGEEIRLHIKEAGLGAVYPHVAILKEQDSTGKPVLVIDGVFEPGQNRILPKENRQGDDITYYFTVGQVISMIDRAIDEKKVVGLKAHSHRRVSSVA
jgi:hypothetical protein